MTLSVLLIGNETLTTECGNLLRQRGHRIAAVVTRSPEVTAWAATHGLPVEPPGPDLAARLAQVDWLLSIANLSVLPAAVLARATRARSTSTTAPCPPTPASTRRSGRCWQASRSTPSPGT